MGLINWGSTPTAPTSNLPGGRINWGSLNAQDLAQQKTINIAKQQERQKLQQTIQQTRQQQQAKGINNPQSLINLQAKLRTGQINQQQFQQQFSSAAKGAKNLGQAPAPNASDLIGNVTTAAKNLVTTGSTNTPKPQQSNGFNPGDLQKINLVEGGSLQSQLIPGLQQQAGTQARLNAQQKLNLTPKFVQNLANAAPFTGKIGSNSILGGKQASAEYLGHRQPNQIILGQGTDPSTVLHEGLHRVWDNNPKERQQFTQAYDKSVTPDLKNYLTARLQAYKGFSKGLDEGGVPIPNYDLSKLQNLPPELQNEVHSMTAEYLNNQNPNQADLAPGAVASKALLNSPLNSYYKQYFSTAPTPKNKVTTTLQNVAKGVAQPFAELGKAVINTPAAVKREIQNKPITDIQQKTFGTADQGDIAKKILSDVAQVGSYAVGGGEVKAATTAGKILKPAAINAGAGAVGAAGSQVANQPKSTIKDILKAGTIGATGGAALTGVAAGVGKGVEAAKASTGRNQAKNIIANAKTPTEPVKAAPASVEATTTKPGSTLIKVGNEAGKPNAQNTITNPTVVQGSTQAIEAISKKQPLNETGSIQLPPTNEYVKEQIALQDAARKSENSQGLGKVGAAKSEAKTKLIDSFAPIEDTLNKSGAEVTPENNIKYQIDRALRADTIGAQYIKDNGLAKVIQTVPNTKEFDQYLIAKHAADLEKNGIETGRNSSADKQLVKDLGSQYEPHAKAIKEYSQNLLDTATNYGLISKDLAASLKEKYPNYVPVNRIFSERELQKPPKGVGTGNASIGAQSVVQNIKGSQRQIESPLSSLVDKSIQVVKQGERNRAAQILTNYKDLPGNPFQLRELKDSETVGNKPVISTLDNGKPRRFETTPEVASAAKSLNKEQLGLLGRILSVPTRVLRLGATGLNPAFALANVTKDTASAFINSSHPLRASVANPKVFMQALKAAARHGSKEYGELVREGAGGTSFDIARNAPKQNIRFIRMQRNIPSKILYTATNPARLLRAAENTIGRSEEFNRAIQYFGNKDSALKKGLPIGQARLFGANAARSNTVNFARAGEYGRVINSVLPYFNAGLQGSRTLLRNLKDKPIQTTTKLALAAFFPTAVVTAWNTSDPKRRAAYNDIKQYEKQGNLIIVPPHPVKNKNGKWNVIKIPVSQEIANLNDIIRNGVETAVHDGSLNVSQLIGNSIGTTTSLNAQSPRQLANQVTPQAIKPGIEALTNQNLFTGSKIVPDSQKYLPAKDQSGKSTSGTATTLGKILNFSPRQIDNAIQTSLGGGGQNLINLSDQALAKTGKIKPSQVQGKSFLSSITGRFKGAQGQNSYDIADQKFSAFSKQLQNLPAYKTMSTDDKAKAINRLKTQVTAAYVPPKDSKGNNKRPTSRQKDITRGKPNLNSYLKAQKR